MFKIILSLLLFTTQVFAAPLTTGTGITVVGIANDVSTGTTQNKLVKLTSASKVVIAGISDIDGIIGVVLNGAGTSGIAQIISSGVALCAFDGTATAGHFVGISSSVAGDCSDVGTSLPLTGQAIGYVLTGGSGAATYTIVMQLRSADGVNGILSAAHGGTGINNGSNNLTLLGALNILGGTNITPSATGVGVWAAGSLTGSNAPLISVSAAPSTPSASTAIIFVDSTDKRLHDINDAGAIGTTVVANTGASNNFLTSISAAGVVARAQPAFTNISGTIATGQVSGSYTGITGVGTLTAGATGAGFTVAFSTSTLTGQIPLANGGTNANLTASNGGIFYSTGSAGAILAGTVTANQCLLSGSSTAPTWGSCSTGSGTVTSAVIATAGGATNTGTCTITTTGTCTVYSPGGYLNKFRNGSFNIWQRGTSALATAASLAKPCVATADGWCVAQAGAQFTCGIDTGNNGPLYSLSCVGGTSNTGTVITQRIESSVAAPLAGQTVTVQFRYKQDTGGSITPKISTCFASATDNFTTCTADLASTSLTACATATWCTQSYTLTASASAGNGYSVSFDCNTALTSGQHCWVTAADVRVTPGVSTGVNANPPPAELRPVSTELVACQRYFYAFGADGINSAPFGVATIYSTILAVAVLQFPNMRATPTVTASGAATFQIPANGTTFTPSAITIGAAGLGSVELDFTIAAATAGTSGWLRTATGQASLVYASAEL